MIDLDPIQELIEANPVPDPSAGVDPRARDLALCTILASPSHRPRRRTERWLPRLGLVAAAGSVAVILGVVPAPGGPTPSPVPGVAVALANAVAQPGAILHTVDTGPSGSAASRGASDVVRQETWASLDGSVQRELTTYANGSFQDLRDQRQAGQYQVTVYWSARHELYVAPWLQSAAPRPHSASFLSVATIQRYADAVDTGHARLDGQTEVNDRLAVRVIDTAAGPAQGSVWYVAQAAHPPVLLRIQFPCRGAAGACPSATTYSTYEIAHSTSSLDLPHYPDAQTVNGSTSP